MSSGAKAGIGVGVVAGVAFLAALIWFALAYSKKRKNKQHAGYDQAELVDQTYVPQHDPKIGSPYAPPYTPGTMGSATYAYNDGHGATGGVEREMIHEAPAQGVSVAHELPGSRL